MSYHKGDVSIDECNYGGYEKLTIQLPHSCGGWIIGGVEEARQMIEDLQAAIQELQSQPKE